MPAMTDSYPLGGAGLGVGALTNALLRAGVIHSEGPPSPAQVFAATGGIGFHYAVIGEGRQARVLVNGLAPGLNSRVTAALEAAASLGAGVQLTPSADVRALVGAVNSGGAVLAWADRATLPYDPMPRGYERTIGMVVGVLTFDDEADEFLVDDRSGVALPIDAARLRLPLSLAPGGPMLATLHPTGTLHGGLPASLLRRLCASLADHVGAPLGNRGIAGIRAMARRIRDPGHEQGWRRIFGRQAPMFHAHAALYRFIEEGAGPGLSRGLMGDCVAELGVMLRRGELVSHSERWRQLGQRWSALARAALPDSAPDFAHARSRLVGRHELFLAEGLEDSDALSRVTLDLATTARTVDAAFPLTPAALALLHGELSDTLESLADEETIATAEFLSLCAR